MKNSDEDSSDTPDALLGERGTLAIAASVGTGNGDADGKAGLLKREVE